MRRAKESVRAEDIVDALTNQEPDDPVYRLSNAQIEGKLDLKNCTVLSAVDIQDCEFLEEVDVKSCEFTQAVNLSQCTFYKDFSSGAHHSAGTVYRKDLVFNRAVFEGAVGFYGSHIEGSAHFWKTKFQNEGEPVDFSMAYFGKTLECEETIFKGPVNFNGLRCVDTGVFYRAKFESEGRVDFGYACFGGNLECDDVRVQGIINFGSVKVARSAFFADAKFASETSFGGAEIGRDLDCDRAVFRGRANFNALRCGGAGYFRGTRFEGASETNFDHASFGYIFDCSSSEQQDTLFEGPASFKHLKCPLVAAVRTVFQGTVSFNTLQCTGSGFFDNALFEGKESVNFGHASFGVNLVCDGATFEGPAELDSLTCGSSGFFRGCTFKKSADFDHASFGKNINCDGVAFHGSVTFRSLECKYSGLFRSAKFQGEAEFSFATFGSNLECKGEGTVFNKAASFNGVRCERSGRFDAARFLEADIKTDFVHTYFGTNLNLEGTHFAGPVDLWMTCVGQGLILTAARFERLVALNGATIGQIEVRLDVLPFTKGKLTMRGCKFARFVGDESIARKLVEAQDSTNFSRDPYLQLERYYSSIGDDIQATDTYRQGRLAQLKNAWAANTSTQWSRKTIVKDWFLRVSTYYGTQPWRLLLPLVFLLVLGTVLFWPDGAVKPVTSASAESPSLAPANNNQPTDNLESKLIYRFGYSFDLLLPVVNLHFEDQWEPRGPWIRAYATVQIVMGWVLIPLLLASLAGFFRRE